MLVFYCRPTHLPWWLSGISGNYSPVHSSLQVLRNCRHSSSTKTKLNQIRFNYTGVYLPFHGISGICVKDAYWNCCDGLDLRERRTSAVERILFERSSSMSIVDTDLFIRGVYNFFPTDCFCPLSNIPHCQQGLTTIVELSGLMEKDVCCLE